MIRKGVFSFQEHKGGADLKAGEFRVVSLGYSKTFCQTYSVAVVVSSNELELLGESTNNTNLYQAVFDAIDNALGPEWTWRWQFRGYTFQMVSPTRPCGRKSETRARVFVHYPGQGDGFAGISENTDAAVAAARAYIDAINRLLIGREEREHTYATVG